MLVDRREELTERQIQRVNRRQRPLAELTPGKVKDIAALQAKAVLPSVRSRDLVGNTRKMLALEQLAEMAAPDAKIKPTTEELKTPVLAQDSTLMDLVGAGPVVAARILADLGDVARFADRNRFAAWTGRPPLDAVASSTGQGLRAPRPGGSSGTNALCRR
jgi:transposase